MKGVFPPAAPDQVLGLKPEISEGLDDDDTQADVSNRKMAKLFMVRETM